MDQSAFILRTTALLLLVACVTDAKVDIIGNQDVTVGDETLLLCKVTGEGEITWQKDREDVDTDELTVTKVDETTSTLRVSKIKMSDAGKYTCLCEYDGGHRDEATMALYVSEGPSFGSTQTYHEFLQGQDGVVPCLVTGQPAVEVHWFRDQKEIPSSEGPRVRRGSDNSLLIGEATRNDTGSYTCQAKITGRPVSKQLSISVVINAPPTVHMREQEMTVMSGAQSNVSFVCLADGSPQPNITWTMPVTFDPSRHQFNSDRSELTIRAVSRQDYGEYVCTGKNKVSEDSATIRLNVHEHPEVYLSLKEQSVSKGQRMTVTCNGTGHPQPRIRWTDKQSGLTLDSSSGRVRVLDGVLMIDDVAPSDGGQYSCMAVSPSGNASRDMRLKTQPGLPEALTVSPGPTSVHFSLQTPPLSGGTPITAFALHARLRGPAADQWAETVVPASDPLVITGLRPYTSYSVRLAAINTVGVGPFSQTHTVQTQGIQGEPDSPVLSLGDMAVDKNSFSLPLKQLDNGGSPLTHYNIRYKDKEGEEWREKQLSPDATSVSLPGLAFGTDYQLEVTAVNANGSSSPAKASFTVGPAPVRAGITKGGVVAIVMVIFLLILIAVDATCCYRNRCGLLMFIAVKLFGQKMPGLKSLEDGEVPTNGNSELTLKGLQPRSNITQQQSKPQQTEITCDKAPLTKHEKTPHKTG